MDGLFARMVAILGTKFADSFAKADPEVMRAEWAHYLADLKPVELERGLSEMASHKFAPTLGEFRLWCRPCLDPEWAFHHARECLMQRDQGAIGDWSHPAEWRAASELNMEVRRGDYGACRARWRVVLERELQAGWSAIPEPPLKISDNRKTSGNSPVALEQRQKIAELLGRSKGGVNAQEAS